MAAKNKPSDRELDELFAQPHAGTARSPQKQYNAVKGELRKLAGTVRDLIPDGAAKDRLLYRIAHLLPEVVAAVLNPGAGLKSGPPNPVYLPVEKSDEEE